MAIKFLTDQPAAYISEIKTLVVADLHLGIEHELYKSGIVIPPQAEKFRKQIERLVSLTTAEKLVILGDLKHKVPGISFREELEIPKMVEQLASKVKIILTKGNHDTELEDIIAKSVKIYSSRGFRIDKYGFFHGHAWPSKRLMGCDWLFMAHIHPVVEFRDNFGHRIVEQVWIRGSLDAEAVKKKYKVRKVGKLHTIIVPVFNKLLGGVAINKISKDELFGPLLTNKVFDVDRSKAYMLDGTFLGSIKQLKKFKIK